MTNLFLGGRRRFRAAMVCAIAFGVVNMAIATQPVRFNYQAKLTTGSGGALSGQHTIFLSLWDGGTSGVANSGALVYSESFTAVLQAGALNHPVGTGTPLSGSLTESLFNSNNDIFVQIAVDSAGNIVLPRGRIESVPFAFHALSAENSAVPSGHLELSDSPVAPTGFTALGTRMFQSWYRRQPLSFGVYSLAAASANGSIYFIGGRTEIIDPFFLNVALDPNTDTTTQVAQMITARRQFTATELNGLIYAVGGIGASSRVPTNEVYDPLAGPHGTWTTKSSLNQARADHAAAAANGHVYVFGGTTDSVTTDSVEEYDTVINTWTFKAPMPAPRDNISAATVNGMIYVTGGTSAANFQYDPVANTWTTKAPLPVATFGGALVSAAGRLYYLGGSSAASGQDTWIYDPDLDAWSANQPLPTVRSKFGAAVLDGIIYIGGGNDETGLYGTHIDALNAGTYYVMRKN